MKKLYPEVEDVPQTVANRAVRIIERRLRQAQVDRARDLPEEARVRLFRDLRAYFDGETRLGLGESASSGKRERFLSRFLKKLEDLLSCSDWSPNAYMPLVLCPAAMWCEVGIARLAAPIIRDESREP